MSSWLVRNIAVSSREIRRVVSVVTVSDYLLPNKQPVHETVPPPGQTTILMIFELTGFNTGEISWQMGRNRPIGHLKVPGNPYIAAILGA